MIQDISRTLGSNWTSLRCQNMDFRAPITESHYSDESYHSRLLDFAGMRFATRREDTGAMARRFLDLVKLTARTFPGSSTPGSGSV
jgi:hypothetical protein